MLWPVTGPKQPGHSRRVYFLSVAKRARPDDPDCRLVLHDTLGCPTVRESLSFQSKRWELDDRISPQGSLCYSLFVQEIGYRSFDGFEIGVAHLVGGRAVTEMVLAAGMDVANDPVLVDDEADGGVSAISPVEPPALERLPIAIVRDRESEMIMRDGFLNAI